MFQALNAEIYIVGDGLDEWCNRGVPVAHSRFGAPSHLHSW